MVFRYDTQSKAISRFVTKSHNDAIRLDTKINLKDYSIVKPNINL